MEELVTLRRAQLQYKLSDEVTSSHFFYWFMVGTLHGMLCFVQLAEDLFRQQTRKLFEENISAALDVLKSRTRAVYDYYHSA